MPLYQFKCSKCNAVREVKTLKYEVPEEICCGERMKHILFPSTIVYKCAGFAITDARGLTGHKRKPKIKVGLKKDLDG